MEKEYILQINEISKRFAGVQALKNVSIDIAEGEVCAIVGENGAGKSTLMNILQGVFPSDSGQMLLRGMPYHPTNSVDAQKLGIAMIHQELSVIGNMTVAENIFLGSYHANRFGIVNHKKMYHEASRYLSELGITDIQPQDLINSLSVSQRQLVEIAKAISKKPAVFIMDEPSSSLTNVEIEFLMKQVRRMRVDGVSVIYISHKLEEVFAISDRIVVLRDGEVVETKRTAETSMQEITSMMVGRALGVQVHQTSESIGDEVVLSVRNLCAGPRVKNVSFELKKGEILGFAGLVGAGRSETAQAIFGMNKKMSGEIIINGRHAIINHPKDAKRYGIGMVSEDRKVAGLFLEHTVKNNEVVAILPKLRKWAFIDKKQEQALAEDYTKRLNIKTPSINQLVRNLSGGNQQKTIVARWLMTKPRIMLLDEPTHGIDVGAKAEIYQLIKELTRQGVSVILISSELPEILLMSDRILVMREGEVRAILDNRDIGEHEIIVHLMGQRKREGDGAL